MRDDDPRIDLLRELADPVRLRVIDRLGHDGPASVSRLAAELGVPLPLLSNHLRRLRLAHLVTVTRTGRHAIYELADPALELLLPMLDHLTGRVLEARPSDEPMSSRTCYGHLAGPLGVGLYRALAARGAIVPRPDGMVDPGPAADETFAALGVDASAVEPGRKRLAFGCLDATERAPHLAGALADVLAARLFERRWIERSGGRDISLTRAGARGLRRALGLDLIAA